MKTGRRLRKVLVLICVGMAFLFPLSSLNTLWAFDFAVGLHGGDTLFFRYVDGPRHEVEVVPPSHWGPRYWEGHKAPSGVLVIPGEVTYAGVSYAVTAIGDRAFSGCTALRHVIIPHSVHTIGAYAFYGCTGINERVRIGEEVTSIGSSAFYGCASLPEVNFAAVDCRVVGGSMGSTAFGSCRSLRKVTVEEGVTRIPDFAFCGIGSLRDSVQLPQSLRSIGQYAFAFCSRLQGSMVIPDGVDSIGECAFHQCHSLQGLTLGGGVVSIGERAFYHCIGLKRVTVTSYMPPRIDATTFANLSKGVKFSVPCVSKALYERDDLWKRHGAFSSHGSCTFSIVAEADHGEAATVTGGGDYRYGDSVSLTVICAAGYAFEGWNDGNGDNPRRFEATGDHLLQARTRPSGIVVLRDTLLLVDTVYAEGYRVVHDTVEMFAAARSVNDFREVNIDAAGKSLVWNLPKSEKVVSVDVYNMLGECVFSSDKRNGRYDMHRLPPGTYFARVETLKRTLRTRFFLKN